MSKETKAETRSYSFFFLHTRTMSPINRAEFWSH